MVQPILTIMLPTTVDRRYSFYRLLSDILTQVCDLEVHGKVEILIDEDEKQKSIGKKRQDLLERSKGEFVVGIDSDDEISRDYIFEIMRALKYNPQVDHVGFLENCWIDGQESKSIFSIRHQKWDENADGYDHIRCANPKSVIRRTKALEVGFEDSRYGEDRLFSEKVTPLLTSEVFIEKELYLYRYNSSEHNYRYGIK